MTDVRQGTRMQSMVTTTGGVSPLTAVEYPRSWSEPACSRLPSSHQAAQPTENGKDDRAGGAELLCCTTSEAAAQKHLTRSIDKKHIKEFREENRRLKLLLLGIGESGKSTIVKQMELLHNANDASTFAPSARQLWRTYIRKNILDSVLSLIGAMKNLQIQFEHDENRVAAEQFMDDVMKQPYNPETLSPEFYTMVQTIWKDGGIHRCFERSSSYQLIDSAKYFLDNISRVAKPDYIPSENDILRCRLMTVSIKEIRYEIDDKHSRTVVPFSVYDVGGQRGERRKWIQVFDRVTAIVFVVDCASFNIMLREDLSRNRLVEALETFHQIWNNSIR